MAYDTPSINNKKSVEQEASLTLRTGLSLPLNEKTGVSSSFWHQKQQGAESTTAFGIGAWRTSGAYQWKIGAFYDLHDGQTWGLTGGVTYRPSSKSNDRDGDGLIDSEDPCPYEAEDEDGIEDYDGCIDPTLVLVEFVDQKGQKLAGIPWKIKDVEGISGQEYELPTGRWNIQSTGDVIFKDNIVVIHDAKNMTIKVEVDVQYETVSVQATNKKGKNLQNVYWGPVNKDTRHTTSSQKIAIGNHFIQVGARGYRPVLQKINLQKGNPQNIRVALEPIEISVRKNLLRTQTPIQFPNKSAKLELSSYHVLNDLSYLLQTSPSITKIQIGCYTDSIGSKRANQSLTQKRADMLATYLEKNGIDPNRIEAIGYGETHPIASNINKKGRDQNNRTVIRVVQQDNQFSRNK